MESVGAVVAFYCACSGGMLVLNKLAVHHVGAPAFVTLAQFVATAAFVCGGWACGCVTLDTARWQRLKHFVVYVLAFSAGTWANMKVLMAANVETVIVFRSCAPRLSLPRRPASPRHAAPPLLRARRCAPLCVCVTDYVFYQRAMPSRRSMCAMLLIALGALTYVSVDRDLKSPQAAAAYVWVGLWFALLIFQLTYGKQLVTGLGLQSSWSPVLYTNGLACLPTALIGWASADFEQLSRVDWTAASVGWLLLSCVAGVGISWAGFRCQALITATAYTVVGVMNKLLTVRARIGPTHTPPLLLSRHRSRSISQVLLNVLIWDKHASPLGIASLCVCLAGGALYQQAPLRRPAGYEVAPTTGAWKPLEP